MSNDSLCVRLCGVRGAQQYDWGVEPREGYFWYIDGVYVLTKYGKR